MHSSTWHAYVHIATGMGCGSGVTLMGVPASQPIVAECSLAQRTAARGTRLESGPRVRPVEQILCLGHVHLESVPALLDAHVCRAVACPLHVGDARRPPM